VGNASLVSIEQDISHVAGRGQSGMVGGLWQNATDTTPRNIN